MVKCRERNAYDHAYIYVSNDSVNWVQIFTNPGYYLDNEWKMMMFDISSVADNQPTVYIRFGIGPTNSSVNFTGWNIDDVELIGNMEVYTVDFSTNAGSTNSGKDPISDRYADHVASIQTPYGNPEIGGTEFDYSYIAASDDNEYGAGVAGSSYVVYHFNFTLNTTTLSLSSIEALYFYFEGYGTSYVPHLYVWNWTSSSYEEHSPNIAYNADNSFYFSLTSALTNYINQTTGSIHFEATNYVVTPSENFYVDYVQLRFCTSILSQPQNLSWLHVDGNRIVDEYERTVILRGVSLADPFQYVYYEHKWNSVNDIYNDLNTLANEWHVNVIRVPISPEYWYLEDSYAQSIGFNNVSEFFSSIGVSNMSEWHDYYWQNYIDPIVMKAQQLGIYVIIDYHAIGNPWTNDPGVADKNGDATGTYPNGTTFRYSSHKGNFDDAVAFWNYMNDKYTNTPNVIFEVWNEPCDGILNTSQPLTDFQIYDRMKILVNIVRNSHPRSLILVGGKDYAGNLSCYENYAIPDQNIVYTVHPYPGLSNQQDIPKDMKMLIDWNIRFGNFAMSHAVFVTEWGFIPPNNAESKDLFLIGLKELYGYNIVRYMESRNLGWTAWCWDKWWDPAMFEEDYTNLTIFGKYVKDVLAIYHNHTKIPYSAWNELMSWENTNPIYWDVERESYPFSNYVTAQSSGFCYGMSSTMVLYYEHYVLHNTSAPYFPLNVNSTYELNVSTDYLNQVTLAIALHQMFDPARLVNVYITPITHPDSGEVKKLIRIINNGHPAVVVLYPTSPHAVVVWGYINYTDIETHHLVTVFYVIDPNCPHENNLMFFDHNTSKLIFSELGDVYASGMWWDEHLYVVTPTIMKREWFWNVWNPTDWFSVWKELGIYDYDDYRFVVASSKYSMVVDDNGNYDFFGELGNSLTFHQGIPGSYGISEGDISVYAIPKSIHFTVDPVNSSVMLFDAQSESVIHSYLFNVSVGFNLTYDDTSVILRTDSDCHIDIMIVNATESKSHIFRHNDIFLPGDTNASVYVTNWSLNTSSVVISINGTSENLTNELLPSSPQNLVANAGDGYVYLTWEAPAYSGFSNITEYRIYRNGILIATVPADQLYYYDTNVVNGETYIYYVTTVNSIGESEKSNEIQATPTGNIPEFSAIYILVITSVGIIYILRRR